MGERVSEKKRPFPRRQRESSCLAAPPPQGPRPPSKKSHSLLLRLLHSQNRARDGRPRRSGVVQSEAAPTSAKEFSQTRMHFYSLLRLSVQRRVREGWVLPSPPLGQGLLPARSDSPPWQTYAAESGCVFEELKDERRVNTRHFLRRPVNHHCLRDSPEEQQRRGFFNRSAKRRRRSSAQSTQTRREAAVDAGLTCMRCKICGSSISGSKTSFQNAVCTSSWFSHRVRRQSVTEGTFV